MALRDEQSAAEAASIRPSEKLEYLHIVAKKVFTGRLRAERRSRKTGPVSRFADHRQYTPGDDLRYLDWAVYGRMDRLLLRLFEKKRTLYIPILVDASESMRLGASSDGRPLSVAGRDGESPSWAMPRRSPPRWPMLAFRTSIASRCMPFPRAWDQLLAARGRVASSRSSTSCRAWCPAARPICGPRSLSLSTRRGAAGRRRAVRLLRSRRL